MKSADQRYYFLIIFIVQGKYFIIFSDIESDAADCRVPETQPIESVIRKHRALSRVGATGLPVDAGARLMIVTSSNANYTWQAAWCSVVLRQRQILYVHRMAFCREFLHTLRLVLTRRCRRHASRLGTDRTMTSCQEPCRGKK